MARVIALHCPLMVDRSLRSGWSGDPATRFVRCEWQHIVETDDRGESVWWEFPNGPRHDRLKDSDEIERYALHVTRHHRLSELMQEEILAAPAPKPSETPAEKPRAACQCPDLMTQPPLSLDRMKVGGDHLYTCPMYEFDPDETPF